MAISLASLQRSPAPRPPKVVVYGPTKVGKSTFAAYAPNPVFIQTEEGLDGLEGITRFPLATSFQEVMEAIGALAGEEHDFATVVLDSLDWTEPLIWQAVSAAAGVTSIEEVGGGYGRGYVEAQKLWKDLLDGLDYLRNERNMCVIAIAHDEIRRMTPPDGEPYDYAALKLHKRAAGMVEEWADVIGRADMKIAIRQDDLGFKKKRARAMGVRDLRTLHVGKNPAFVTGNRFGMPNELPLDWEEFAAWLPGGSARTEAQAEEAPQTEKQSPELAAAS